MVFPVVHETCYNNDHKNCPRRDLETRGWVCICRCHVEPGGQFNEAFYHAIRDHGPFNPGSEETT